MIMKCTECPEYNECSKKYNLTIKRRRCPKAKEEKVVTNADRIVQCGKCANSDTIDCSDGMVWCKTMCRYMKEDGFCSLGERKGKK